METAATLPAFRVYAQYIGQLGLTSKFLPGVYVRRSDAAYEALLHNAKPFTPYFYTVREVEVPA